MFQVARKTGDGMKVAIVSGAGSGLGRALCRQLAARGDMVVGIGRREQALHETGEGLPEGRYRAVAGDVADPAAMAAIVERVVAEHGRVDALVANAAVYPRRSIEASDPLDWMGVLHINVGGVFNLARAVLPAMKSAAHGRIVVVGSFAHVAPIADSSAYSASKAATSALTRSIAAEVGPDYPDILVNEWVPGSLRTEMGVPDGIPPEVAARWGLDLIDASAGGATGRVYNGRDLVEPPQSLKRRVLNRLRLRR